MSSRNVFLVSYHVYVIDNSQVDKYCRILLWLQYIADNNNIFVWKTICHILFHNTKTYLGLGVLQSYWFLKELIWMSKLCINYMIKG